MTVRTSCNFQRPTMLFPCPLYTGQEIGSSVPMGQYWASAQSVRLSRICVSVLVRALVARNLIRTRRTIMPLLDMSCSLLWNFETVYPHTSPSTQSVQGVCRATPFPPRAWVGGGSITISPLPARRTMPTPPLPGHRRNPSHLKPAAPQPRSHIQRRIYTSMYLMSVRRSLTPAACWWCPATPAASVVPCTTPTSILRPKPPENCDPSPPGFVQPDA